MTTIKKGYRMTIISWENDADNYRREVLEGLSEDEVKFYLELCKLHVSKNGRAGGFGNAYEYESISGKHEEAMLTLAQKYQEVLKFIEPNYDMMMDYLYMCLGDGEFYTRVFESVKIEYVPHDIHIEDVTDRFTS